MSIINSNGKDAVQANWSETDASSLAYIQNKPTIPSGSELVPSTSGVTDGYVLTNSNGTPTWAAGGGGGGTWTRITSSNISLLEQSNLTQGDILIFGGYPYAQSNFIGGTFTYSSAQKKFLGSGAYFTLDSASVTSEYILFNISIPTGTISTSTTSGVYALDIHSSTHTTATISLSFSTFVQKECWLYHTS